MILRIPSSMALALLTFGALTAHAEEYAVSGQLELGGTFQIANVTQEQDGAETVTSTAVQISPIAGYWVSRYFQVLGSMDVRQLTIENGDFAQTSVTVGFGPGAFVKLGNARLGPYVLGHVLTETLSTFGAGEDRTTSGPGATLGVQFKLPVAGGGVVVMGASADYSNIKFSTEADSEQGTYTTFGTSVGFLGYF